MHPDLGSVLTNNSSDCSIDLAAFECNTTSNPYGLANQMLSSIQIH